MQLAGDIRKFGHDVEELAAREGVDLTGRLGLDGAVAKTREEAS